MLQQALNCTIAKLSETVHKAGNKQNKKNKQHKKIFSRYTFGTADSQCA